MSDRTRRIVVATCIAVALIAYTAWRIHLYARGSRETPLTYVHLADQINAGEHPPVADVSPLYLRVIVMLRRLSLTPFAIVALQLAALTLAAFCCALVAKRYGGWTAAIATAVLILGNRAAFLLATQLDPKTLIFLLTSAALALLPTSRQPLRTSLAALLLGLNAITHPYGYLILLVVALFHRRVAMIAAVAPVVLVLALTPKTAKHSSSQFYEGNNPLSTCIGGVAPVSVMQLQAARGDASPDPAYRMLGTGWTAKAIANIREYPLAALHRFAWKALLTIHDFNGYDVAETVHASMRLPRFVSLPFGLAFALAAAALLLHRDRRALAPFVVLAVVLIVMLTLFVVSARQRNVLLVPLAILGGIGAASVITLLRERLERGLLAFGAVLIATALLGIEGRPMREHAYRWTRIAAADAPEAIFDRAVDAARRREWLRAEVLLATIADYRPLRGTYPVSSVAYYRARVAMHLHAPAPVVQQRLAQAQHEAPGDPFVLALRAVHGDRDALRVLDALHDPLTRDLALAVARDDQR